jgi:cobalt/nickel transport system permease protein
MHISEGVLSGSVLISGGVLAAAGTAIGLKKLDYDRIAHVGLLSASFFIASLIHVPLGPANVHLVLNGIVGLLLGWAAFPAIIVALVLHAVLFQFGGFTSLGVNTMIMAMPSVLCYYFFRFMVLKKFAIAGSGAFACGFFSVFLSAVFVGLALVTTDENFFKISGLVVVAHFPVMIIEGIITAFFIIFIKKVQPSMLPGFTS